MQTAAAETIAAIVAALTPALTIPVYDGNPTGVPSDLEYVVIGGGISPTDDVFTAHQSWHGMPALTRYEEIEIRCTAIGRASRNADARTLAFDALEQTGANLPQKPTAHTYNAIVARVERMAPLPLTQAGVQMRIQFVIGVSARLTA
jgi:hypothetical protein